MSSDSKELDLFPKEQPIHNTDFTIRYKTLEDLANSRMEVPSTAIFDNSCFNNGANAEIRRLREALDEGVEITTKWADKPIIVPRMTYNQMIEYLDGADIVRGYVGQMAAYGGKIKEETILMCWKHAEHLRQ